LYSLQFNENVKIRLQMSSKQQRRQSEKKILDFYQKKSKTGLFQHNNVTTMRPFAHKDYSVVDQQLPTLLDVVLRPFAHPVAYCWAKFETSQTFSDLQTELLANNVASVCTGLNSSF